MGLGFFFVLTLEIVLIFFFFSLFNQVSSCIKLESVQIAVNYSQIRERPKIGHMPFGIKCTENH